MLLTHYNKGDYSPGKPLITLILWHIVSKLFVECSLLPFSGLRVALLKLFGAKIGAEVRIKPGVRVKFPWRLTIGNSCWIGEDVWIDNLDTVSLGDNVVLSQGTYLCTGNHDWSAQEFTLRTNPIHIESQCWIAARSVILPGTICHAGSVLTAGSVASSNLEAWYIYSGTPAQKVKARVLVSP